MIIDILKVTIQLQNNIELNDLEYTSKKRKLYNFSISSLPDVYLWDIHEENLSLQDADKEQSQLVNKLKDLENRVFSKEWQIIFQWKRKKIHNFSLFN